MPNETLLVSISDRCRRGLLRSSSSAGVSKFGGSSRISAGAVASVGKRLLQRHHHAMS